MEYGLLERVAATVWREGSEEQNLDEAASASGWVGVASERGVGGAGWGGEQWLGVASGGLSMMLFDEEQGGRAAGFARTVGARGGGPSVEQAAVRDGGWRGGGDLI